MRLTSVGLFVQELWADGDGVVQKDEANLMSFLRVSPVRKFSWELIDLMDINKDGYLSLDDSRPLENQDDFGGGRWKGSVCQFLVFLPKG